MLTCPETSPSFVLSCLPSQNCIECHLKDPASLKPLLDTPMMDRQGPGAWGSGCGHALPLLGSAVCPGTEGGFSGHHRDLCPQAANMVREHLVLRLWEVQRPWLVPQLQGPHMATGYRTGPSCVLSRKERRWGWWWCRNLLVWTECSPSAPSVWVLEGPAELLRVG